MWHFFAASGLHFFLIFGPKIIYSPVYCGDKCCQWICEIHWSYVALTCGHIGDMSVY